MAETDTTRHFLRECGGETTETVRDSEMHEFTRWIASVTYVREKSMAITVYLLPYSITESPRMNITAI